MLYAMSTSERNDHDSHIANLQAQLESLQSSLESAARQVARVNGLLNAGIPELAPSPDRQVNDAPSTFFRPPAPSAAPPPPPEQEEEDYSRRIDNNEVLKGVDERLRGLAG